MANKILDSFAPEKIDLKDIEAIEDVEDSLKLEADRILLAKATKKQQRDQMSDMRDTQYYAVVVFANKNDREKFTSALQNIDIEGDTFIDGYELAAKMGINIQMTASLPEPHYIKQLKLKNSKIKL